MQFVLITLYDVTNQERVEEQFWVNGNHFNSFHIPRTYGGRQALHSSGA